MVYLVGLLDGTGFGINFGSVAIPPGLSVHRELTRPLTDDQLPAIAVYTEDDAPVPILGQRYGSPILERQLIVSIEYRALGTLDISPDTELDPVIVWGTVQIVANERFNGLASGVTEGKTTWLSKEADQRYSAASQQWTIHYRTSRQDPTLKS